MPPAPPSRAARASRSSGASGPVARAGASASSQVPVADPVRRELARLAAMVRLAWWTEVGALRFARSPRSGDEVDAELVRLEALGERPPVEAVRAGDPQLEELAARCAQHEATCRAARKAAPDHPLYRLAERAGLDALALDLLLLAMAPEIDDGFGRVAVFLRGGGASRRALDVATAGRVLAPDGTGADAVRRALTPSAPLERLGLVTQVGSDGQARARLALSTLLVVPSPVVAAVLGLVPEDAALRAFVRTGEPPASRADVPLPDEVWARLAGLLADPAALPLLEGPTGVGRRESVRVLCGERGLDLIEVDVEQAPDGLSSDEAIGVARLAWLRDAALVVRLPPIENGGKEPPWRRGVSVLVARHPGRLVLVREPGPALPLDLARGRRLTLVPIALPEPPVREQLWRRGLGAATTGSTGVDAALLAHNYPLTPTAILRASEEARLIATARGASAVELRDVIDAVDVQFAPRLQTVGRRLRARARFDQMVLPEETRETLLEMEATIRLRHRVLDEWKLARLVRGRGVSALFYGEPGTGKTMAAGAIADAAGLPLYQIDTAQVVSKWIGETEKNLGEVFRAAEAAHAMLLFDEADAIFGKRTDVEHSTDRYANMQTNFLLTQIELFNGISILTTNRESVMDPAFQRRLTFRVYFPMPEVAEREDIWRRMLAEQPRGTLGEVDTSHLAQRLVMSGGYIRNAVLRAAYLSAAADAPLSTETLRHAAELVLRDAGKVI